MTPGERMATLMFVDTVIVLIGWGMWATGLGNGWQPGYSFAGVSMFVVALLLIFNVSFFRCFEKH